MRTAAVVAWLVGCTSSGSLDLELQLPNNPDLRPQDMTTITVLAQSPAMDPIANTAQIDGSHFSAGDLPVGKNIAIDVLLHDVSNRLVGIGEAPTTIDIDAGAATQLSMPVRRPFVYAASGSQLYSYDPSLNPIVDMKFQGQLQGLSNPAIAISVGGDQLVVASGSQLQVIETATNMVKGSPIAINGAVHDVAPVPGASKVAVAHGGGLAIVDLDSQAVTNVNGPSVDRITVGPATDGTMTAFGLVGRVTAPAGPTDMCAGVSSLVTAAIDGPPGSVQPMALSKPVSDIAANPAAAALFATEPCDGKVVKLDGEVSSDVALLERAAVLTVAGGRIWAAGSHASSPVCLPGNTCPPAATAGCSSTTGSSGQISYVVPGANVLVESIPITGGQPVTLMVPERRETFVNTDDEADQHAEVLHSLALEPLDLVALPGGQYVSLVTTNTYYITELVDQGTLAVIIPCLLATTGDWLLLDMASSSVAQRVRTQCNLTVGAYDTSTIFRHWKCDDAPAGQASAFPDYMPVSVGAIFGAR
jgi:hypothetical protein